MLGNLQEFLVLVLLPLAALVAGTTMALFLLLSLTAAIYNLFLGS